MLITLTKKFSRRGDHMTKDCDYLYGDGYISDGRFMIRQDCVKNKADYIHNPAGKMDGGALLRVIPNLADCKTWTRTEFFKAGIGNQIARIYKCGSEYALILQDYVKLFDLHDLESKSPADPFCNFDQSVLVMPMRVDNLAESIMELAGQSALFEAIP